MDDETTIRDGFLKHMIRWEQEGFRLLGDAANGQGGSNPDPSKLQTARDRDHDLKCRKWTASN